MEPNFCDLKPQTSKIRLPQAFLSPTIQRMPSGERGGREGGRERKREQERVRESESKRERERES